MKVYNPMHESQFTEIATNPEDNKKLLLDKYTAEARRIAEDIRNHGDN